jgi:hypothetical protein
MKQQGISKLWSAVRCVLLLYTCMQLFRSEKEDAGLRINMGYYTGTKKELQRTQRSVVTVLPGRLLEPGLVVHVGKQKISTEIWWRKRQLGKLHR